MIDCVFFYNDKVKQVNNTISMYYYSPSKFKSNNLKSMLNYLIFLLFQYLKIDFEKKTLNRLKFILIFKKLKTFKKILKQDYFNTVILYVFLL